MRAITYRGTGGPDVLSLTERELDEPAAGQVRVRVAVSGVNPTDWKRRRTGGLSGDGGSEVTVPNQDGAGVVDAVGPGVSEFSVGDRVWLILAAYHAPTSGTAQEYTVLPVEKVIALPDGVGFDEGAALGIPALTAHRALTVAEDGPTRLGPGALAGRTILVTGGAGAVGNATIQLARWAGATVLTSVSTDDKAELARRAGAHYVLRYTSDDFVADVRKIAPDGLDLIVEVAAGTNAALHPQLLRTRGTVAVYGDDRGTGTIALEFGPNLWLNSRYQFLVLYTVGTDKLRAGAEDVNAALKDGSLAIGPERGLPLHRYPLADTAEAHRASENGAVGKVLIDVHP
ncbi:NADPH:quinone reductase [Pseudonocardia spinosispora]|uniref:NADPH:quinone reductase n=1 Tax=Pseudonocardia spinosispora TaxID=103441 RepID=UPI000429FE6D|nr:NADPH:quinone reductase [Pseudonocardia spinosispora]